MASDVANEVIAGWPVEDIHNEDYLFLRVHRDSIDDDGTPIPGAFKNQPRGSTGMSTDWQRYATSAETRRGGRKPPEEYAVVKFTAGNVRKVPGQSVVHEPDIERNNRAHTEVVGDKTTEVRERFMQIYEPEISLSAAPS